MVEIADKVGWMKKVAVEQRDCENLDKPVDRYVFSGEINSTNWQLIEVPGNVAASVLCGENGEDEDLMAICTNNSTYIAKNMQHSNTLILTSCPEAPPSLGVREFKALGICSKSLELVNTPPCMPVRFRDILQSVQSNPFHDTPSGSQYTLRRFYSSMPVCENAIKHMLKQFPVFEFEGFFYSLSWDGREELVYEFTNYLEEFRSHWQLVEFKQSELHDAINNTLTDSSISGQLLEWIVNRMCNQREDGMITVNVKGIVREISIHILRRYAKEKFMSISEFETHFRRIVPVDIEWNVDLITGVGFFNKQNNGIRYLNSEELPLDASERLGILFGLSFGWSLEDIRPYFVDFVGSEALVYQFLSEKCRTSLMNGKTMFYSV